MSTRPASSPRFLVHGFSQTPASWGSVASALDAVAVAAPVATLWDAADQLATHGRGTWIGYSMGGRMVLHLALAHPECVERLVLVSATAGIEDDAARAARVASDEALAARAEALGADAFVAEWVAQPMFADVPPLPRCDDAGAMAAQLRLAGTGTQSPLWDRLGELAMPVLVVAGELDRTYVALGERLVSMLPDATLEVVAAAGHGVPFARPDAFVGAVRDWLEPH